MKRPIAPVYLLACSTAFVVAPSVVAPFEAASRAFAAPSAALPANVAAEINGDRIMRADLDRMVNSLRDREPSLATGSTAAQAALEGMRSQVLDNLIEQRLLFQEARRRKIAPSQKAVDNRMLEIKRSISEAQFQKMLADSGKTAADFRQRVVEALSIEELSKRLSADVIVPDTEIAAYYKANKDAFTSQQARAHHILFGLKANASPAERAKQLSRAQAIVKQAGSRGADFEKLARANSEDPSALQNGGDLGVFAPEEMVPGFSEAVFDPKTPVGKVMGKVVESAFGFHVIRVDERKARVIPLGEATPLIQARLLERKIKARLETKLQQLRAAASIKRFDA